MLPEKRKQLIINLVNDQRGCSVEELASKIDVSESTIRRDLQELEEQNIIQRTHGGAVPIVNRGRPYDNRRVHNLDQKVAIGKRAAEEIHKDQVVIFDGGTTTLEVAKQIPTPDSLVTVTPMPQIAHELADKGLEAHLTGGIYQQEDQSSIGPWTQECIQQMDADLVILGADGIDENGLSIRDIHQYRVKSMMVENAKRVVLVADHSKFNDNHPFRLADHAVVDLFITDGAIPDTIEEAIEAAEVTIAKNVYS
jgi:DeoR family fructose operon transcriptional repressor